MIPADEIRGALPGAAMTEPDEALLWAQREYAGYRGGTINRAARAFRAGQAHERRADDALLAALEADVKAMRAQAATLPHYFPGDSATKVPVLAEIIQGHFNDIADRIDAAIAAAKGAGHADKGLAGAAEGRRCDEGGWP